MADIPSKTRTNRTATLICLLSSVAWAIQGCGTGSGTITKREGQTLFGETGQTSKPQAHTWSVAMAIFTGPDRDTRAQQYLDLARQATGFTDLRLEQRGDRTIVAAGSFENPRDAGAQRMLAQAKQAQLNGRPIAASAILMPPKPETSTSPYDLSKARQGFAPDAVLYSLQIGLYGDPQGGETPKQRAQSRLAAEQAASTLRAQGEEAFVHHGDRLSTVSVGVFREDQIVPGGEIGTLLNARRRHPHTLLNGEGVRGSSPDGKESTLQPSLLVRVPEAR